MIDALVSAAHVLQGKSVPAHVINFDVNVSGFHRAMWFWCTKNNR